MDTTFECPIGLDCQYFPAEKHFLLDDFLSCSHKYYCKRLAAPWPIPYKKKYQIIEVSIPTLGQHYIQEDLPDQYYEELKEIGWSTAEKIPYKYCEWEFLSREISEWFPFPVLVVDFYFLDEKSGMYEPKFDQGTLQELVEHGWAEAVSIFGECDSF